MPCWPARGSARCTRSSSAASSPDSLAYRITDCTSNCVITADEGVRGGRKIPLKANTDEALKKCPGVKSVVVVRHTGGSVGTGEGPRRLVRREEAAKVPAECAPEEMGAEDLLFHPLHLAARPASPVWA